MNSIHQPHDKLFKQSMADSRFAKEFFETYLSPAILKKIELTSLKLQKDSFIDEAYQRVEADVVYSVNFEKTPGYLYILCEHQSAVDNHMTFRLLIYIVRILDMHRKQHPHLPLPIVYPMVVYTGEKAWTAPLDLFELFGEQKELAQQVFFKPFQLIDIHRMEDKELRQHLWSGVVAFVLKYRQARDFAQVYEMMFQWLRDIEAHQGADFAKNVLSYVIDGVESGNEKVFIQKAEKYLSAELRGEVMTLAQQFEQRGLQQGMQQGMQQGEKTILLTLLQRKFGTIPPHYQRQLDKANPTQLLEWANTLLDAQALSDVFEK